jgi:hypothetical protein
MVSGIARDGDAVFDSVGDVEGAIETQSQRAVNACWIELWKRIVAGKRKERRSQTERFLMTSCSAPGNFKAWSNLSEASGLKQNSCKYL